jgi:hypothetical protein
MYTNEISADGNANQNRKRTGDPGPLPVLMKLLQFLFRGLTLPDVATGLVLCRFLVCLISFSSAA